MVGYYEREFYSVVHDVDPVYEKLERKVEIQTRRNPPSFSEHDYKTFFTNLDISLKKKME